MPQLDLYNFVIIILYSIIGIAVTFVFFQKHWLYSWKLLTIITVKIKNITSVHNVLFNKISVIFIYSFFFFNTIICFFFFNYIYNLYVQSKISTTFLNVIDINQLKTFL